MLVRLMYASHAAANLDNEEVTAILRKSRVTNAKEGLTGALCLCNSGRLFIDSRAAALVESGDVVMGIQEGHFAASHRRAVEQNVGMEIEL